MSKDYRIEYIAGGKHVKIGPLQDGSYRTMSVQEFLGSSGDDPIDTAMGHIKKLREEMHAKGLLDRDKIDKEYYKHFSYPYKNMQEMNEQHDMTYKDGTEMKDEMAEKVAQSTKTRPELRSDMRQPAETVERALWQAMAKINEVNGVVFPNLTYVERLAAELSRAGYTIVEEDKAELLLRALTSALQSEHGDEAWPYVSPNEGRTVSQMKESHMADALLWLESQGWELRRKSY